MMILLLCKIARQSWASENSANSELQDGIVVQLTKIILENDELHVQIGLQAIDQLITEMTCPSKGGLAIDRRISINFKNSCLETIFRHNIELLDYLISIFNQIPDD